MEAILFAIVVIVAIVRAIFLFFRWAIRSLKRLSGPGATYAPLQPMTPQQATPAAPPATSGRPAPRNTFPSPAVGRETTTLDFQNQETQLVSSEPQSLNALRTDVPAPASLPASAPLFGATSDLVRALILQEVLGPPLSKRQQPPIQ